jgi:PilZ domain
MEHRRSQRVMVRLSVTLELGSGREAKLVRAHTVSVNDHGALLISAQPLAGGTKAELKNDRTGEQQACHVVRNAVEMPDGYYIAVEFDSPAKGFWHISFPPTAR